MVTAGSGSDGLGNKMTAPSQRVKLNKTICLTILIFAAALLAGCGGGGGGGGGSASTTTGTLNGVVDRGAVARVSGAQAGRSALVTALASAQVTVATGGSTYLATANTSGYYQLTGIPAGNFIETTATSGSIILKAFANVAAGQTTTKNINARTTAAAMVYKQLTTGVASDISVIEDSTVITPVETEIETALAASTYNYNTVYSGTNCQTAVATLNSCIGSHSASMPTLGLAYPAPCASVSDVDFRADTFYIEISFADTFVMNTSTLNVTLKMDNGAAQDITSYFQAVSSTALRSTGLYAFNRTLFVLASNDHSRMMKITVSMKDMGGNSGTANAAFTVYPVAPPSQ
jgi:hypothetical protein